MLLSTVDPEGSGFLWAGVDAMVFRLPVDGTECSFFLSGEDRRYLAAEDAEKEQTFLTSGRVRRVFNERWVAALNVQYFYMDQVFDASTTEVPDFGVVLARGHSLGARPTVGYQPSRLAQLGIEVPITRQWFDDPLDSYWELGPRGFLRYELALESSFEFSYETLARPYDTRTQYTTTGISIEGTELEYRVQTLQATWRQQWDRKGRWRTVTRAGLELSRDNGDGYFDYDRYFVTEQVQFRTGRWEFQAAVRASLYDYAVQTVAPTGEPRYKRLVTAGGRIERRFGNRFKAYAEYELELSGSNDPGEVYDANTLLAGMDWEF